MTKSQYRYKRYLLYLPKAIGDRLDPTVDYVVQLYGPAIVLLPKRCGNLLSPLEKLGEACREKPMHEEAGSTDSWPEDSRVRGFSE